MSFTVCVCVCARESERVGEREIAGESVVPRKKSIEHTIKYVKHFTLCYSILTKTMI